MVLVSWMLVSQFQELQSAYAQCLSSMCIVTCPGPTFRKNSSSKSSSRLVGPTLPYIITNIGAHQSVPHISWAHLPALAAWLWKLISYGAVALVWIIDGSLLTICGICDIIDGILSTLHKPSELPRLFNLGGAISIANYQWPNRLNQALFIQGQTINATRPSCACRQALGICKACRRHKGDSANNTWSLRPWRTWPKYQRWPL